MSLKSTNSSNKPLDRNKSYPAWLGFARREFTAHGTLRLKLNFGRIAILLVVLLVGSWAAKTIGLYFFFRDVRKFSEVTMVDTFLFPINRASVRIGQGNYQIKEGLAAVEREEYRRAYLLLREGVARAPSNMRGREVLAQMYLGWRPDLAVDILAEGLDRGELSSDYLRLLFSLLIQQRQDSRLLQISEHLLGNHEMDEDMRRVVLAFRMQGALLMGQYQILHTILSETDMRNTLDGVLIATQFFRRSGDWQQAVDLLVAVIQNPNLENNSQLYNQLIDTLKMGGQLARAREIALEMTIRDPMDWRPRIRLIDLLSASELTDRRDREIRAFIQEQRTNEEALTGLAGMVAEYGKVWAASRLYELALENGFNLSVFSLSLAEALIQSGKYQQAIELCNELAREAPMWLVNAESSFNAIRALAYLGAGNTELGQLYLSNFINARGTQVNQLYRAALSFNRRNFPVQALEILEAAFRRDNANEQVLAKMIDLEIETGAFFAVSRHLRELFRLRRPDYEILERIVVRLRGDRFVFTEGRFELLQELETILQERHSVDLNFWRVAS